MTLLEAMSAGLPIVAFDCPSGLGDLVAEGDNGLLVPAEDIPALARAMRRVLADDTLRRALSAGSAARAQRFDVEGVGDRWQSLLESAARGPGRMGVGG